MEPTVIIDALLAGAAFAFALAFILYQRQNDRWLRRHGSEVVATITSIERESGRAFLGIQHDNYYITAQWTSPRTGKSYTFWKWIMHRNPQCHQGSMVPVLIDPDDPHCFMIEL